LDETSALPPLPEPVAFERQNRARRDLAVGGLGLEEAIAAAETGIAGYLPIELFAEPERRVDPQSQRRIEASERGGEWY